MRKLLPIVILAACSSPRGSTDAPLASTGLAPGEVASFDGVPIRYDAGGAGDPALVFVHGWACNRGQWADTARALASEQRVVAIDLGGHGESGCDRERWLLEGLGRDVVAVVDALGLERVVLVGHSMGGPVSLYAARELGEERVVGVVGIDTLHDATQVPTAEQMGPFLDRLDADYEGFYAEMIASAVGPAADPALAERLCADAAAACRPAAVGLIRSFTDGYDPGALLAACPAPVRCINAAAPNATNFEGNRRFAPDFEAEILEGVGHWIMLERPDELRARLRAAIAALD